MILGGVVNSLLQPANRLEIGPRRRDKAPAATAAAQAPLSSFAQNPYKVSTFHSSTVPSLAVSLSGLLRISDSSGTGLVDWSAAGAQHQFLLVKQGVTKAARVAPAKQGASKNKTADT